MADKSKIKDNDKSYLITMTTVGGVDVFTKKGQKLLMLEYLNEFIKSKGIEIYGYCLMSNHLHIICRAKKGFNLSTILKNFKKSTSKSIIKEIKEGKEKRKSWLLEIFSKAFDHLSPIQKYKVWQGSNQAILLYSDDFLVEKLNLIHNDPVEAMIVDKPTDYIFSSARNYASLEGVLDVIVLKHLP